jgi:hypothetical protein
MIPREYKINKLSVIKMINIVKNKIPQCKMDATPPINAFPIFIVDPIYKDSENNPNKIILI